MSQQKTSEVDRQATKRGALGTALHTVKKKFSANIESLNIGKKLGLW